MRTEAERGRLRTAFAQLAPCAGALGMLLGLAALVLIAGCDLLPSGGPVFNLPDSAGGASPLAQQRPMTYTLTLLHTNDTWGYVDPCG